MSKKKNNFKESKKQKETQLKEKLGQKYLAELILILLSIAFVFLCLDYKHIQDDAFITFRYAKNFINGNGLVFNVGEHVEGYTSIFWTLFLSVFMYFDIDIIPLSQMLGIIFGISSIWFTFYIAKNELSYGREGGNETNLFHNTIFTLLPSVMLAFTGAFQYWSISGMEVSLFVSLSLLSVLLYMNAEKKQRPLVPFSVIASINSLVRPEGILLFVLIILHHWIKTYRNNFKDKAKDFIRYILTYNNLKPVIIFIAFNFLFMIFRLFYYGYILPNTFYAKTGFSMEYFFSGIDYIWDFLKTYLLFGLVLLLPLFQLRKYKSNKYFGLLLLIIIFFMIYTILVGGDVLPLFRFLLPVLPYVYILFITTINRIEELLLGKKNISNLKLVSFSMIFIVLALTAFNYINPNYRVKKFVFYENQLVEKMTATSKWLQEKQNQSSEKLIIACSTIGAVSFYTDASIIDMLGLTDETIAHHPKPLKIISGFHTGWKERNYNADYILSRKPDYIYFSTGIKPSAYAERALFLSEEFVNNYYPYFFSKIPGFVETIFKRKSESAVNKNFVKFNSNPNFDSNYVNLYNEVLNIKSKPEYYDRAISLCEQIDKIRPLNFYWAQYQLALLYERTNSKDKVFSLMKDASNHDDYLSPAHFYVGKQYIRTKEYDLFKHHFELVEKYNPEYLEYERNIR